MNEFRRERLIERVREDGLRPDLGPEVEALSQDHPSVLVELALLDNGAEGEHVAGSVVMKALAALNEDAPRRTPAPRRTWMSAAAAVFVLFAGAAASWAAIELGPAWISSLEPAPTHAPAERADPQEEPIPSREASASNPEASASNLQAPAPSVEAPAPNLEAAAEGAASESRSKGAPARVSKGSGVPARRRLPAVDAATLFEAADEARRRGATKEAIALYRKLQRRFPARPEATVSRVSLGQLLLARDRPASAESAFRTYLEMAPRGPLVPEALVGQARALEKLGRSGEERQVWQRLLRDYPRTLHRRRAEARLQALE